MIIKFGWGGHGGADCVCIMSGILSSDVKELRYTGPEDPKVSKVCICACPECIPALCQRPIRREVWMDGGRGSWSCFTE